MHNEKFSLKLSKKRRRYFFPVCALLVLCFCLPAAAQSGRRKKNAAPSPTPVPVAVAETGNDAPPVKPSERISSIVVFGEFQNNPYYRSNHLRRALEEFVRTFNQRPLPQRFSSLNVAEGGKLNFAEARARAKKQTNEHVLWIGFVGGKAVCGDTVIAHIDYALLAPQTGTAITRGQIVPGRSNPMVTGSVLRLPSVHRHADSMQQMEEGARAVAAKLVTGGWLD